MTMQHAGAGEKNAAGMRALRRGAGALLAAALLASAATAGGAQGAGHPMPATADCATQGASMTNGSMDHAAHQALMARCAAAQSAQMPTQPGQAAFGAIAEIVKILEADPKTDWSRVNLEALHQHLIDMDEVTLRANVAQADVPGGFRADVTGSGRTVAAIRRMTASHAGAMAGEDGSMKMKVEEIPNGARMTVTAAAANDAAAVTRLRGLGFIGVMASGDHHQMHHLMIARGEAVHGR